MFDLKGLFYATSFAFLIVGVIAPICVAAIFGFWYGVYLLLSYFL